MHELPDPVHGRLVTPFDQPGGLSDVEQHVPGRHVPDVPSPDVVVERDKEGQVVRQVGRHWS